MIKVSIIVLSFNRPDSCARTLGALANLSLMNGGIWISVTVVDNGSAPDKFMELESAISDHTPLDIALVRLEKNKGYSAGMNAGLELSAAFGADFFWLLNDDIYPEKDSLQQLLVHASADRSLVIIGPTYVYDGSDQVQCAGGCFYNSWLGYERMYQHKTLLTSLSREHPSNFDYIYGAAPLIDAKFLRDQELLDETFFLFFEELTLARKMSQKQRLGWCADAVVFHATSAYSKDCVDSALIAGHATESAIIFTARHYPLKLPTVIFMRIAWGLLKGIAHQCVCIALAPWQATARAVTGLRSRRDLHEY